jgi:hypothetical protein
VAVNLADIPSDGISDDSDQAPRLQFGNLAKSKLGPIEARGSAEWGPDRRMGHQASSSARWALMEIHFKLPPSCRAKQQSAPRLQGLQQCSYLTANADVTGQRDAVPYKLDRY